MKKDLHELKNLGKTSVNWLRAIGVNTYDDLVRVGPVGCFVKLKQRGFRISVVLLYAIEGALQNTHWNEIDGDLKKRLVSEAEQRLKGQEIADE